MVWERKDTMAPQRERTKIVATHALPVVKVTLQAAELLFSPVYSSFEDQFRLLTPGAVQAPSADDTQCVGG